MRARTLRLASAHVAAALLASATSSGAAPVSPSPAMQQAVAVPQSGWMTLSMLTPSGAIGLAGAAGQPMPPPDQASSPADQAPPPPRAYGTTATPPLPVIGVWLATLAVAVYILSKHHHGRFEFPQPGSPG